MVQIVADPRRVVLARQAAGAGLEAMNYDVVEPDDVAGCRPG